MDLEAGVAPCPGPLSFNHKHGSNNAHALHSRGPGLLPVWDLSTCPANCLGKYHRPRAPSGGCGESRLRCPAGPALFSRHDGKKGKGELGGVTFQGGEESLSLSGAEISRHGVGPNVAGFVRQNACTRLAALCGGGNVVLIAGVWECCPHVMG